MKYFRDKRVCFALSIYALDAVPISLIQDEKGEATARKIIEDAAYLSDDGSGQFALEWLRVALKGRGRPILHLLIVRNYNRSVKSCTIRHEAAIHGIVSSMEKEGYILHEISYDEYLKVREKENAESAFVLQKSSHTEQGLYGNYASYPYITEVDHKKIYETLEGSGCSLSIQIIPSLTTSAERQEIIRSSLECRKALDGTMGNLRDGIAQTALERWNYYRENMDRPVSECQIVLYGSASETALLSSRIQQSLKGAVFSVKHLKGYLRESIYNLPWRMISKKAGYFHKWTSEEAARVVAFPDKEEDHRGIPHHSFSLLQETDLLPAECLMKDGIVLGMTAVSKQILSLSPEEFVYHTAVFGTTGMGKTSLLKQMIRSFDKKMIPVLVLEPVKKEYRTLVSELHQAKVFTAEQPLMPLLINPFLPPKNVFLRDYKGSLLTAFKAAFSLPDPLPSLFEKAISEVYRRYGWRDSDTTDDCREIPDMQDFIGIFKQIIEASSYSREVKGNMMAGGAFRLESLLERCPVTFDTFRSTRIEELLEGRTIVEMGGLESEQKILITSLLLISVLSYLKANRKPSTSLQNIILLDEVHALLDQGEGFTQEGKQLHQTMNQLMKDLLAEIRAYGVGVVFSDQSPSRLPSSILDNTDHLISFHLSGREAEQMAEAMGGGDEIKASLSLLELGDCIFMDRHLRRPVGIKTRYEKDKGSGSDYELLNIQKLRMLLHKKDYCPFKECPCDQCSFSIREEANVLSSRILFKRNGMITDVQSLAGHIVKTREALKAYENDSRYSKLCVCTAVQLARRTAKEKGVKIGANTIKMLVMNGGKKSG